MKPFGYKLNKIEKFGIMTHFLGHRVYTRIFVPEQINAWRSPICPICGYKEEPKNSIENNKDTVNFRRANIANQIVSKLKSFWPKERTYYWIMGLNVREKE